MSVWGKIWKLMFTDNFHLILLGWSYLARKRVKMSFFRRTTLIEKSPSRLTAESVLNLNALHSHKIFIFVKKCWKPSFTSNFAIMWYFVATTHRISKKYIDVSYCIMTKRASDWKKRIGWSINLLWDAKHCREHIVWYACGIMIYWFLASLFFFFSF